MSASIAETVIRQQLSAMVGGHFEIGVLRRTDRLCTATRVSIRPQPAPTG
jgi:hypothetical protein